MLQRQALAGHAADMGLGSVPCLWDPEAKQNALSAIVHPHMGGPQGLLRWHHGLQRLLVCLLVCLLLLALRSHFYVCF